MDLSKDWGDCSSSLEYRLEENRTADGVAVTYARCESIAREEQ